MTIRRMGVALALVAGCMKRPYEPAGGTGALHVAGIYAMQEELYSGNCPGASARKGLTRVEVKHETGASMLKLTVDAQPFDAYIRKDGSFESKPLTISRQQTTYTTSLNGRFTDSSFFARLNVSTTAPLPLARPGLAETRICNYQFRWAAKKM